MKRIPVILRLMFAAALFITTIFITGDTFAWQGNPVFEASFDTNEEGFIYIDDTFRGTNQPGYADGNYSPTAGYIGGALQVYLGGVNDSDINNMSGGWHKTFTVNSAAHLILSFRYNLIQLADYESSEISQVMVSVDSVLYGSNGMDYVDQIAGNGNGGSVISTGWQIFYASLGLVEAGEHTIVIGGYNNRKTTVGERTEIIIDDLSVSTGNLPPIADAGQNVIAGVESESDVITITLDGSGSSDPDGLIVSYDWSENGISVGSGETVELEMGTGEHIFTLTVMDDSSATAEDEVTVTVNNRAGARELVNSLSFENYKLNIKTLSDFGDRNMMGSMTLSALAAQAWAIEELESFGYTVVQHPFSYSGGPRFNIYATKIGATNPDKMYIISAHIDGRGGGGAANDDGSGSALVLEAARAFAQNGVETGASVRFILWANEESGLNGAKAYAGERYGLQGIEEPSGSGEYPEPTWLGVVQSDMLLFDHGLPVQQDQIPGADIDVDYQVNSTFASESAALAAALLNGNTIYSTDYPAEGRDNMSNTDSVPFQNLAPSVSVRENNRLLEIGNGSDPQWHQPTDVYATYSEADFLLGFNAVQLVVGTIAEMTGTTAINVSVDDEKPAAPDEFALEQNYPNPFNMSTIINYSLPKPGNAKISIYNIRGQKIRTLVNDHQTAGNKSVIWNGINNRGQKVSSGIYIVRFESGSFAQSKKMIVVK